VVSPTETSPPRLAIPRKLVSHLEAGPYWDKPVGPQRAWPSNFYLNTPLEDFQYTRFPVWMIPEKIMKEYNLYDKVKNGFVYVELRRRIYGLKESGILANLLLKKCLSNFGYRPVKFTHGLWKYDTRPISFTLVVDDFGVK